MLFGCPNWLVKRSNDNGCTFYFIIIVITFFNYFETKMSRMGKFGYDKTLLDIPVIYGQLNIKNATIITMYYAYEVTLQYIYII